MSQVAIPICYFPGTVIFVDDSRDFLTNFTLQLDEMLAYKLFSSPFEAVECLKSHKNSFEGINQRCMSEYLESTAWPMTNQTVNVDLSAIHSEVYNSKRFQEATVVVVDYAMPGMNGLEFCREIKDMPVKKILLTGQADEAIAIQAFNEGLIDKFIRKNQSDVTSQINHSIEDLQINYYKEMSEMIIQMLALNSPHFLNDPLFAKFFNRICRENQIVEYYLTENTGSFLLMNADAEPCSLIVKSEQDLKMYYELACDNNAPQTILEDLKLGRKIPYFWQANELEWNEWSSCLFDAKKIEGEQIYYYGLVENFAPFEIKRDKILSYNQYLDDLDKNN